MNNFKKIKSTFPFKINKYTYYPNIKLLDTDRGKFIVKKNIHHNNELFRYLETKNFNNFLSLYDYSDDYEVYPYIDNVLITNEEKALDIIYLITLLHNKTTFYKETDIDNIKRIYEDINNKLIYLNNYYENIRMIIEEENLMSPSRYLFLINSSIIFTSIDNSKKFIDKWYSLIKEKDTYRVCTIHNYLDLDHLLKGDNTYLINWYKSCVASSIYDLLSLYKYSYEKIEFSSLFELYNSKYPLYEEELYLLFSLLLVPTKIEFNSSEVINTNNVYELINYLNYAFEFISKYQSNDSN